MKINIQKRAVKELQKLLAKIHQMIKTNDKHKNRIRSQMEKESETPHKNIYKSVVK